MNFIWLEDFLALAATGSFSRAAEARHSSQPAFSRRIRALEAWVGVDLLDRSTQPARLTVAGEWFQKEAQELLARVARVPGDAKRVAETSAVTLRLASTHALSFTFLPRWLRRLESAATIGPVQLMSDVLQRCEILMQQGKVQFVLSHAHPKVRGTLDSDAYLSAHVGDDVLIPVSAPDPLGRPLHSLDAETAVPILRYSEESGLGRILQARLGARLRKGAARVVFTAHLASVLRTMALDGRGIAWLPQTLVEEDLASGRLVPVADADWSVPIAIRLYRERELTGRAAEALWASGLALSRQVDCAD
ncbi:LysR family transcriptional regulator [Castellaniella sp.]|uniref:LysR family transcriptional regulator n=1 Tax=Castellaniella sp. TaxID=1955812 RepID=UPI002AFE72FC|nr:LysR family transcriptional regulator [Castellaniella sp.]